MAKTRVESIEREAVTKIYVSCLEAQEQTVTAGLTSAAAQQFIEALPSIETLMQPLSFREIAGDADPPVVEQLVNPSALRQRRYREQLQRHVTVLLRHVTATRTGSPRSGQE